MQPGSQSEKADCGFGVGLGECRVLAWMVPRVENHKPARECRAVRRFKSLTYL